MNSQETVQALIDLVQRGDFDRAKTLLSDDFRFKGLVRNPISGKTWLRMSASLNMGVISATHKNFSTVRENNKITVKDEKVSLWVVEPTEGAGLKAILDQLGVRFPTVV